MHGSRRRAAGAALACLALGTVSLSACSAGPRAQTANQYSVVDGAIANVGAIAIRDAGVAAPDKPSGYESGDTVQLAAQIVNNGSSDDELLSVKTASAQAVTLSSSAFSSPLPTPAGDSATPSASAKRTGSATPTTSKSSAPSSVPLKIPGNTAVVLGGDKGPSISLDGLTQSLGSGQTVSVTFTFRTAGSVTVTLPVKLVKNNTGGQTVDIAPTAD